MSVLPDSLNDLPQRSVSHEIDDATVRAFEDAIGQASLFVIQRKDNRDYGTDVQLEACSNDGMKNIRLHVQLKGTEKQLNRDGSVSIQIDRTNLNYLLRSPRSLYICYHLPSKMLFFHDAEDLYRQYSGKIHSSRKTITIRFKNQFSLSSQQRLHELVIASGESALHQRLQWGMAAPEQFSTLLKNSAPSLELSGDPQRDYEILRELYSHHNDAVISSSFIKFEAVLSKIPAAMALAYMAEINLGINGSQFSKERVRNAIPMLEGLKTEDEAEHGELEYSIANAYMALKEYELAIQRYSRAISTLESSGNAHDLAMCYKNIGAAYAAIENIVEARKSYEKALELSPDLPEAQFALAICLHNEGCFQEALSLLDAIVWSGDSSMERSAQVQAWRVSIFFNLADHTAAFREIYSLLGHSDRFEWIFPWCARHVWKFGTESMESISKALVFWRKYLLKFPSDITGMRASLLCVWRLHENGQSVDICFGDFKQSMINLIDAGDPDPAFIWDRIGHWAQTDGRWEEAEAAYRKAFELEPEEEYGYCLGVTLNHLKKYAEALPILLSQAEKYQPDEHSWFYVAQAYEGIGDVESCTDAYRRAIELNPNYAQVWFEFGGSLLNLGHKHLALDIWEEAIARFPEHEMVKVLGQFFEGCGPAFGGVK